LSDEECEEWLKRQGFIPPNFDNFLESKYFAIHEACKHGELDVIEYLLKRGLGRELTKDEQSRTALMVAVKHGQLKVCRWIMKGADARSPSEKNLEVIGFNRFSEDSALQRMKNDSLDDLKSVLGHFRDRDGRGANLLMLATESENLEVMDWVVAQPGGEEQLTETNLKLSTSVMWATQCSSMEPLLWHKARNVNLHQANKHQNTCLLFAGMRGKVAMVEWLVEQGCNVYQRNVDNEDLLMLSAQEGHFDMFKWCLDLEKRRGLERTFSNTASSESSNAYRFSVTNKDIHGNTVFLHAVAKGKLEIAKYLFKHCNVDPKTERNRHLSSSVLISCMHGHLDMLQWLVDEVGCTLRDTNVENLTAVMMAAANGHNEIIRWLVSRKVFLQDRSIHGHTALHYTAKHGHVSTAKLLVSLLPPTYIKVQNREGEMVMEVAVKHGKLEYVQWLVEEKKWNVHICHSLERTTLLCLAVIEGRMPVIDYLLSLGVSVEERTSRGMTAVMLAAGTGRMDVVRRLVVDYGAAVDTSNGFGITAMNWAAQGGFLPVLEFLYCRGSPLGGKRHRCPPAVNAAGAGHIHILKFLLRHGCSMNERDIFGRTPASWAAEEGQLQALKWLARHGVDLSSTLFSTQRGTQKAVIQHLQHNVAPEVAEWIISLQKLQEQS
jgi:ankyrin repeat protein